MKNNHLIITSLNKNICNNQICSIALSSPTSRKPAVKSWMLLTWKLYRSSQSHRWFTSFRVVQIKLRNLFGLAKIIKPERVRASRTLSTVTKHVTVVVVVWHALLHFHRFGGPQTPGNRHPHTYSHTNQMGMSFTVLSGFKSYDLKHLICPKLLTIATA